MITDRRKFTTVGINLKSYPWPIHSVQETTPNFLRRVENTADNADITQSQAANHLDY